MKNIVLPLSSEIHPSYFEYAYGKQPVAQSSSKFKLPSLTQLVHVSELCVLLVITILVVGSYRLNVQLPPPATTTTAESNSPDVEKQLEQVGQILDYLLKKVENPPPLASSSDATPAKSCRIAVAKAVLRTGPGKDFSPLLTLAQDSELLVEDEAAEWLQVIAPTGQKAWVSKQVVKL